MKHTWNRISIPCDRAPTTAGGSAVRQISRSCSILDRFGRVAHTHTPPATQTLQCNETIRRYVDTGEPGALATGVRRVILRSLTLANAPGSPGHFLIASPGV